MTVFKRAQFQEAAVQHIVTRLRDKSASRRMLLADEVGLGKTVVARGVIESLMKRKRTPLTVVYLCSNAEIAEQNRRKLDPNSRKPVGRVTQLVVMRADEAEDLRLYSFTPGTSLRDGTGLAWERRLLMYLLHRIYGVTVWRAKWREFFRCGAGRDKWREETTRGALRQEFARKTERGFQKELAGAWRRLNVDSESVGQAIRRLVAQFDSDDPQARFARNQLVARLRGVMQRVILRHLRPDLVVLDEVQRFREVLDEAENAQHIAAELFTQRAPVRGRPSHLVGNAVPCAHARSRGGGRHGEPPRRLLQDVGFSVRSRQGHAVFQRIRAGLKAFGERLQSPTLWETRI